MFRKNNYVDGRNLILICILLLNILLFRGISANGEVSNLPRSIIEINYTDHSPIIIDSDDDFVTNAFPGTGTSEDPYRIENFNISERYVSDGILIYGTTKHFIIQNCYIWGPEYGIYLREIDGTGVIRNNIISYTDVLHLGLWLSDNNIVENNNVSTGGIDLSDSNNNIIRENTVMGIDLENSHYNKILNNSCIGGYGHGIKVYRGNYTIIDGNICREKNNDGIHIERSNHLTITDNECSNNNNGIHIEGSVAQDSENITLSGNKAFMNDDDGIYIYAGSDIKVSSNELYSNDYGLYLSSSRDGLVTYNLIQSNTVFGINAISSYRLIIHHNIMKYNGDGSNPQAKDETGGCTWYDNTTNEGNYWSDWDGSGEYELAGPPGTSDPYPLSEIITTTEPAGTDETTSTDETTGNKTDTDPSTPSATSGFSMIIAIIVCLSSVLILPRRRKK